MAPRVPPDSDSDHVPYVFPSASPNDPRHLPSANGGTILALGIISLVFCGMILGPIAWIIGNNALQAIDFREADPSERGIIQAGRTCGMVATWLHIITLIIVILCLLNGQSLPSIQRN